MLSLYTALRTHSSRLRSFSSAVAAATSTESLHALIITAGTAATPLTTQHGLITAYAADGDLQSARKLFDRMPTKTSVSFNSLIAAYSRSSFTDDALILVRRMMHDGLRPTQFTFGPILSSLSFDPLVAAQIHPLILKLGVLTAGPFTATALLGLLARSGRLDEALELFVEMPQRTLVTWNSIISAFSQHGYLQDSIFFFRELLKAGIGLSECSFLGILSGFRSPENRRSSEQVHGLAMKTAMISYLVVANALVGVYSACSGPHVAEKLFLLLPVRDVVSWNTMIAAFANGGSPFRAVELFIYMIMGGFSPDEATFVSVLGACADLNMPEYGELIHAKTIKNNIKTHIPVGTSLIGFYSKCKSVNDAEKIFNEMPEKNTTYWNALISAYSNDGRGAPLPLLKDMLSSGFSPNEYTFSSGLKSTQNVLDLQQLHSLIIRLGCGSNEYVSSAIIASYGAFGLVSDALACGRDSKPPFSVISANIIASIYNLSGRYLETLELLSQVQDPDVVTWNILLTACARNEDFSRALELFKQMRTMGYLLDNYTVVSLLSICSKISSLVTGTLLHGLIIKTGTDHLDFFVQNLLLDMYAKCGSLEDCSKFFNGMDERNLISWTALISAQGLHGCAHEALESFNRMESEGFEPDRVTFLTTLSACRHGGLVEEGMALFEGMNIRGVEPEMDHYTCVVDLLSRHGYLNEAERVIRSMPFRPDAIIWRIFLHGCKRYGCK